MKDPSMIGSNGGLVIRGGANWQVGHVSQNVCI